MAGRPRPEVIALFGPTGVGKTGVAIALAETLAARGEPPPVAISADALQVYEGLESLTGAATEEERRRLEHRLVGFLPVTETFSAGEYARLAHAEIDAALAAGRRPIVVGGTGLYLRAALTDLALRPSPAPGVRERLTARLEADGPAALHVELAARAPEVARTIAPADRSRVVRALELLEMGEDPAPEPPGEAAALWTAATRRPTLLVGLVMARDALDARIDARVDELLARGAAEQVRRADAAGASRTARKALGFKELLRGDVEAMRLRTRRYARRQLTWMRKLAGAEVIDVTGRPPADVARELLDRATAPAPASAHGTIDPAENQCDCTATPNRPVDGSRATSE